VVGLVAIGCVVTSCACLPLIGALVFGPIAWRMGLSTGREIAAQPGRYRNGGHAVAALWLGAVSTVLGVLLLLALIAFLLT
jgi:hypothetical protein